MDYFTLMGLPRQFAIDRGALDLKYFDLQRQYHPDRFANQSEVLKQESLRRSTEINEAYLVLKSDTVRAGHLLELMGSPVDLETAKPSQALLMEMIELREALDEAGADELQKLETDMGNLREEACRLLAKAIEADAAKAKESLIRLHYIEKCQQELITKQQKAMVQV